MIWTHLIGSLRPRPPLLAHAQHTTNKAAEGAGLKKDWHPKDWKIERHWNIHTYIDIHWYRYVLIYSRLNGFKSGGPKQVPNVPKRGSSCGQKKTEWKAWYGAMQHHGVAPQWTDGGCTSSCSQFVEQFRFWPNIWAMNYHSDILWRCSPATSQMFWIKYLKDPCAVDVWAIVSTFFFHPSKEYCNMNRLHWVETNSMFLHVLGCERSSECRGSAVLG